MNIKSIAIIASTLLLVGCGGSSSSNNSITEEEDDKNISVLRDTTSLFPHSFELSSITPDIEVATINRAIFRADALSSASRIDELLAGTLPLKDIFTPELLYRYTKDAECYGPTLLYKDHPDSTVPNSGELPSGDLGIWSINEGVTTQACSAAQLDARMQGVKTRTMGGLFLLASSLDAMYNSGQNLPAVGAPAIDITSSMPVVPNVTFNSVSIEQIAVDEYQYSIDFTYTRVGTDYDIKFQTIHKAGSSSDEYMGLMTYQIQDRMSGGNCGVGDNDITKKGTLIYERVSSDDFKVDAREADFCTHSFLSGLDSNGLLDANDRYDNISNPDGWGNNFNRFVSNYKNSNKSGQYSYVWQAGPNDSHSRVLQIDLNNHTPVDGESYFGYGAQIFDTSAIFGENLGLICNWAAQGSSHTPQLYAQRQFLTYDTSTTLFETSIAGSNITYAPTNNCTYLGNDSFEYDRDLNGSLSIDDIATVKVGASGSSELEFDLFDYTGSTVAEMIINRGAHLPIAPIW